MPDELFLDYLRWISVALALILTGVSMASVGRHFGDLEYQKRAGINGIRRGQSITSIRMHANRVILALVYLVSIMLAVLYVDIVIRAWVNLTLFILLLVVFMFSSVCDWISENLQLDAVLEDPLTQRVAEIREDIHKIRSSMQVVFGLVELCMRDKPELELPELHKAVEETRTLLEKIQVEARALDPSYKPR